MKEYFFLIFLIHIFFFDKDLYKEILLSNYAVIYEEENFSNIVDIRVKFR